jgi:hypothetical protein
MLGYETLSAAEWAEADYGEEKRGRSVRWTKKGVVCDM